jgi:hypothetical protein
MPEEVKSAPALSATSDKPDVTQQPADASNKGAPPDQDKAAPDEGKTTEKPAASENTEHPGEEAAADADGARKPAKGVQKRLDELTKRAGEAERRFEQAMALVEKLTGAQPGATTAKSDQEDPKPTRDKYEDPDKFAEDLAAWTGRKAAQAAINEERTKTLYAQVVTAQQQLQRTYDERVEKAKAKLTDWADVVMTDELQISVPMAQEIVLLEHGPEVAYYLGKHPAEAKRISLLDARSVVREMARIEAKVLEKPAVSSAPNPVKPVGSRNAAGPKSPEDESMEEYAARRTREEQDKRRPGARRASP